MRRMAIVTAAAIAFCLAVSLFSHAYIGNTVRCARRMRTEAIDLVNAGENRMAVEKIVRLAQYMKNRQGMLEILCEHEELHGIKEALIDARSGIEFGSREDFYQAMYGFGEKLEHIADEESLRFSNFY